MRQNVGKIDRAIRGAMSLYTMRRYRDLDDFKSWRSGLAGFWLMTAAFGYCPVYQMFGVNTRRGQSMNLHLPNVRRLAFWR